MNNGWGHNNPMNKRRTRNKKEKHDYASQVLVVRVLMANDHIGLGRGRLVDFICSLCFSNPKVLSSLLCLGRRAKVVVQPSL